MVGTSRRGALPGPAGSCGLCGKTIGDMETPEGAGDVRISETTFIVNRDSS